MGPNQPWGPSNSEGLSPSLATSEPQQAVTATETPLQHPTSQLHLQVCGRVPQEDVLILVKWSHFSWQPGFWEPYFNSDVQLEAMIFPKVGEFIFFYCREPRSWILPLENLLLENKFSGTAPWWKTLLHAWENYALSHTPPPPKCLQD